MLFIRHEPLNEMIRDATGAFPDECCGFFYGREEGEDRYVERVLPVHNAKEGDKRRRFEISARDYLQAERYGEENGLQLLGVYHSHPDHPAQASETDRQFAQPYFSYVILSVMKGLFADIRSWRLNDEHRFEEESINKNYITI